MMTPPHGLTGKRAEDFRTAIVKALERCWTIESYDDWADAVDCQLHTCRDERDAFLLGMWVVLAFQQKAKKA